MNIQINQQNIINLINKDYLTELLAKEIIQSRTNPVWEEFDDALKDALRISVKEIAEDYINNYYSGQGIENQIKSILEKMTKEDIIKIMSNHF